MMLSWNHARRQWTELKTSKQKYSQLCSIQQRGDELKGSNQNASISSSINAFVNTMFGTLGMSMDEILDKYGFDQNHVFCFKSLKLKPENGDNAA